MEIVNFFERKSNNFEYLSCKQFFEKKIPYKSLFRIRKNKVKKSFEIKNQDHFLRYRFELLKRFIYANQRYTRSFVSQLDMVIETLWLTNELNSYENEFVNHYNAVVFAQKRNLKNFIIEFPLMSKREKIFYKYDNVFMSLEDIDQNHSQKISFQKIEFFLTTKRIVGQQTMELYSIEYKNIVDYKVKKEGFVIWTKTNKFTFSTYDPYVLYVSFERMLKYLNIRI